MEADKSRKISARKELIIRKAAHLFRENGYTATSMRDLAESVGVEAASLYNHIRSKGEILQEICFSIARIYTAEVDTIVSSDFSAIRKIEAILRFHIRQMIDNFEYVHVSDREWKHLTEPFLSDFRQQRRTHRQRIAAVIEEAINNHDIKNVDAQTAVLVMLHAVSGIESWHRNPQKISEDQLEDHMVLILIEGLRSK